MASIPAGRCRNRRIPGAAEAFPVQIEGIMTLLVLGLVVFLGIHAFSMARGARASVIGRIGEGPYKGLYSLASLAGIVLIAIGYGQYRAAGYIPVWDPPVWIRHLALLLVWIAFVLFVAAYLPGQIGRAHV